MITKKSGENNHVGPPSTVLFAWDFTVTGLAHMKLYTCVTVFTNVFHFNH